MFLEKMKTWNFPDFSRVLQTMPLDFAKMF